MADEKDRLERPPGPAPLSGSPPAPTTACQTNGGPQLANLSPERLALLALLARPTAPARPEHQGIARVPHPKDANPLPLSFGQERLWFLQQLQPDSPVYNELSAFELTGALDPEILHRSFQEVLRRHEAWRTTFRVVDGQPRQVIASALDLALPRIDLGSLSATQQEAEVQRLAFALVQRPFDLTCGPLVRLTLLRLGANNHRLLLVTHHIISDRWSQGVLFRELGALYRAYAEGQPSPLPALPFHYADFAHWQRQWLHGEVLQRQLAYWRRQLEGAPAVLELPTAQPRSRAKSYQGARQGLVLDRELTQRIQELSRQEGVTLFMTLLAAFQVLLSRYSGQEDIVVGIPVAGRTHRELEGLLGFFVNTLVLRTDLAGNPTFRELLGRVREVTLGAYAHQDLPFEKLVEALQPQRILDHAPLFQVLLVLPNTPASPLQLGEVAVRPLALHSGTAKYDLTLALLEQAGELRGGLEYNSDLFTRDMIVRLQGHFQTLLAGIVADPNSRLAALPLLTESERQQLLVEWNATARDFPRQACVPQLFEDQVERTPGAVALVFAEEQLTYHELNTRANQLAHYLRGLGIGPETLVGIALERSPVMVVGLLGILKAGGAYVALDPSYPPERLALLLQDTQPPIVLTQAGLLARLPRPQGTRLVCLDAEGPRIAAQSTANLSAAAVGDNLAYVIYTSGSTGQPKGVLVQHQGLTNLALAQVRAFDIGPGDRVLQFAALSFDASVSEVWVTLLAGATLCLAPREALLPGPPLERLLLEQGITVVTLPPSILEVMPDHPFPALRTLVVAGEACSAEVVRRWAPGRRLVNAYGPTEGTVCATVGTCTPGSRVTIGRPIDNVRVYVLDRHGQPVPVGVAGELYLGGVGLARGYLGRPDLTAERFVPDPFSGQTGARLYKTGDRVRYLPAGDLEFLGRLDDQVKLRGFRIEPAEVEAVLNQHPAVRESIVVARDHPSGDKRLLALVVLQPGQEERMLGELAPFAAQKLPAYLVPSAFGRIDCLPLTPQGKLDRHQLQNLPLSWPAAVQGYVPPTNPLHYLFVQVWEELLNIRPIGIMDDFFERGGHSLLAVRMVARLDDLCGRKLPLVKLFAGATIAELSAALLESREGQVESPLLEIQAGAGARPFFFLHGDFLGGGLYCRNLARQLGAGQPFYAIQPHGLADQELPPTLEVMAAQHLRLLRQVQPQGPYLLGGYCGGALEAFEMAQQLQAQGQRVDLLALIAPPTLRPQARLAPLPLPPKLEGLAAVPRRVQALRFCTQLGASYVPRHYPGQILLLQPGDQLQGTADLSRGWGATAAAVEVQVVAGGHETVLTTHVAALAEQLRRRLRDSSQKKP